MTSPAPTAEAPAAFDEWCIVELLGHRRLAGHVREIQFAGAGFLRLDIPGDQPRTQYVAPGSVYALHPVTEDVARRFAAYAGAQEPVRRWELPAPEPDDGPVDDGPEHLDLGDPDDPPW